MKTELRHPCIYILTDMEGVCGVENSADYCLPGARFYDSARRALSEELNAAVRGCFDGGFASVVVLDGHGSGHNLEMDMLDRRIYLQSGYENVFHFDKGQYDAIGFVGQHAKAGAKRAQLSHTQSAMTLDFRVNGLSVGEYGQWVLCAAEAGIPVIFGTGDLAFTEEARALTPWVATVAVKEGLADAPEEVELTPQEVHSMTYPALHYPKKRVLEEIYDSIKAVSVAFTHGQLETSVDLGVKPPIVCEGEFRPLYSDKREKKLPARHVVTSECATVDEAMREYWRELSGAAVDGVHVMLLTQ